MSQRLAVFDMDGTLVDSMSILSELGISLIECAFPHISVADAVHIYQLTVGIPFRKQLDHITSESIIDKDRITTIYERLHRFMAPEFQFTGLGRELASLTRRREHPNWRFAMVTSTRTAIVNSMSQLSRLGLDHIDSWNGDDVSLKPGQIMAAMRMFDVPPERTCYIGDTKSDIVIAEMLGVSYWRETTPLTKILATR